MRGQSAPKAAFEVASVKRVERTPGDPRFNRSVRGGPGTSDPGRAVFANVNMAYLLKAAFGSEVYRVFGPDWITSEYYTVDVLIPPKTTQAQFDLMLQNLLAERFHLVAHHETKDFQGYELKLTDKGPKLAKSADADLAPVEPPRAEPLVSEKKDSQGYPQLVEPGIVTVGKPGSSPVAFHLIARAQTLSELAKALMSFMGYPIVDKTGMNGRYDFYLDFTPETARPLDDTPLSAPLIPDAVKALGLRLTSEKLRLQAVIVDSLSRVPTAN